MDKIERENSRTDFVAATPIDWVEARRFLRTRFLQRMGSGEREDADDLTQEACVRLRRALRSDGASGEAEETPFADPDLGDPGARLRFIVHELFARAGAHGCGDLAAILGAGVAKGDVDVRP